MYYSLLMWRSAQLVKEERRLKAITTAVPPPAHTADSLFRDFLSLPLPVI
jgi:hypothetical protein